MDAEKEDVLSRFYWKTVYQDFYFPKNVCGEKNNNNKNTPHHSHKSACLKCRFQLPIKSESLGVEAGNLYF